MEAVLEFNSNPMQLKDINLVQIYLQVTTLSKISMAQGTQILQSTWKGKEAPDQSSTLEWPQQEYIMSGQRTLWRQVLKQYFLGNKHQKDDLKLPCHMGKWIGYPTCVKWKYNIQNIRKLDNNIGVHNKTDNRYLN